MTILVSTIPFVLFSIPHRQNYSHCRRNGPDAVWAALDSLIAEHANDGEDEDSQQEPLGRKLASMTVVRELLSQHPFHINSFFDYLNETFKHSKSIFKELNRTWLVYVVVDDRYLNDFFSIFLSDIKHLNIKGEIGDCYFFED